MTFRWDVFFYGLPIALLDIGIITIVSMYFYSQIREDLSKTPKEYGCLIALILAPLSLVVTYLILYFIHR